MVARSKGSKPLGMLIVDIMTGEYQGTAKRVEFTTDYILKRVQAVHSYSKGTISNEIGKLRKSGVIVDIVESVLNGQKGRVAAQFTLQKILDWETAPSSQPEVIKPVKTNADPVVIAVEAVKPEKLLTNISNLANAKLTATMASVGSFGNDGVSKVAVLEGATLEVYNELLFTKSTVREAFEYLLNEFRSVVHLLDENTNKTNEVLKINKASAIAEQFDVMYEKFRVNMTTVMQEQLTGRFNELVELVNEHSEGLNENIPRLEAVIAQVDKQDQLIKALEPEIRKFAMGLPSSDNEFERYMTVYANGYDAGFKQGRQSHDK